MKIKIFLIFAFSAVYLLAQGTQSKGPVVIDTFAGPRTNSLVPPDDNRLWREVESGQCVSVTGISGGLMSVSAPSSGTTCSGQWVDGFSGYGMSNIAFFPASETGWAWASPCTVANGCQYTQSYAMTSGADWTALNRLYFTITGDTSHGMPTGSSSGSVQIGYYVRSHDNTATQNQGAHYYNFLATGIYAGQPLYFVLNRKAQHNNTGSATDVYPEDPEWNACCNGQGQVSPVHWWDGMTTMYTAAGVNLGGWTGNFNFGQFSLGTEQYAEPDDFVSAITGTFTGPNASSCCSRPNNTYEVTWEEPKLIPGGVNYHIYYSSAGSMHVNGLSSGASGSAVRGPDGSGGAAYMNTAWNSPSMTQATNMWVAIRPDIPIWKVTGTNPITIQTRAPYDRHWLHTGDQVNIANLCSAANGTRTVTVMDNFTVSLGVSGSCSYGGYTGTGSATMTATSDTANFTEIVIGPGGATTPPTVTCDLNGDGVVNSLDYQIAVNQALGQAACTDDLNGDGLCNVVEVQRVANAAAGGACRVGP